MLECKICGKNLYQKITFNNMFIINYEIHKECIDKLVFNTEEEVIPIEENIIIYDYVFNELEDTYNKEYLWEKYFSIVIKKQIENIEWSMILFNDDSLEKYLETNNPYLLLNLTNNPILLISLEKKDISYLEAL